MIRRPPKSTLDRSSAASDVYKGQGTSIASLLAFLEAEYGAARVKAFIGSLDPDLRKRCEGLVLASAFYPVDELESPARQAWQPFGGDAPFYELSLIHISEPQTPY